MDWVTLGLAVAAALISFGTIIMKVGSLQEELTEHKKEAREEKIRLERLLVERADRYTKRFEEHGRRLNDQDVAHQAIHTSLQFIISKLDGLDSKLEERQQRRN